MNLKKYLIVTVICILIIVFVGCINDKGISIGFNVQLPKEEGSIIYVAYSSETNEIKMDHFSIQIYYGWQQNNSIEQFPDADFNLIVYNLSNTGETIQRVVDNFDSEKYRCVVNRNNKYSRKAEITYNYSETLEIPREFFVGQEGEIVIMVSGKFDNSWSDAGWNSFAYKRINDEFVNISKGTTYSCKPI